ncbi:hypothetical protein KC460_05195, partial [Candidatus Dependentiae bacterium]|nr:hypothetical protein [Candidatus Dependentiae bacterium]
TFLPWLFSKIKPVFDEDTKKRITQIALYNFFEKKIAEQEEPVESTINSILYPFFFSNTQNFVQEDDSEQEDDDRQAAEDNADTTMTIKFYVNGMLSVEAEEKDATILVDKKEKKIIKKESSDLETLIKAVTKISNKQYRCITDWHKGVREKIEEIKEEEKRIRRNSLADITEARLIEKEKSAAAEKKQEEKKRLRKATEIFIMSMDKVTKNNSNNSIIRIAAEKKVKPKKKENAAASVEVASVKATEAVNAAAEGVTAAVNDSVIESVKAAEAVTAAAKVKPKKKEEVKRLKKATEIFTRRNHDTLIKVVTNIKDKKYNGITDWYEDICSEFEIVQKEASVKAAEAVTVAASVKAAEEVTAAVTAVVYDSVIESVKAAEAVTAAVKAAAKVVRKGKKAALENAAVNDSVIESVKAAVDVSVIESVKAADAVTASVTAAVDDSVIEGDSSKEEKEYKAILRNESAKAVIAEEIALENAAEEVKASVKAAEAVTAAVKAAVDVSVIEGDSSEKEKYMAAAKQSIKKALNAINSKGKASARLKKWSYGNNTNFNGKITKYNNTQKYKICIGATIKTRGIKKIKTREAKKVEVTSYELGFISYKFIIVNNQNKDNNAIVNKIYECIEKWKESDPEVDGNEEPRTFYV